jgi:hypothetical protein
LTSASNDTAQLPEHITYHFFAAVMPTLIKGEIYTDQTGRFRVTSSSGNSQIFVLYDYDSNIIHTPMPTKTAAEILKAFKTIHNDVVLAGLRPQLQRLDYECSTILQEYLVQQLIAFQFVPPGMHRANSADRAIRTFKTYFLAGFFSTDPDYPMYFWDRLLSQAILALNLLCRYRKKPTL